ncbi:MAG: hypothetical protein IPK16_30515 [Anaerolineales bacterium]|nr:hypothetical protein [Anaerolineales bacterium]
MESHDDEVLLCDCGHNLFNITRTASFRMHMNRWLLIIVKPLAQLTAFIMLSLGIGMIVAAFRGHSAVVVGDFLVVHFGRGYPWSAVGAWFKGMIDTIDLAHINSVSAKKIAA